MLTDLFAPPYIPQASPASVRVHTLQKRPPSEPARKAPDDERERYNRMRQADIEARLAERGAGLADVAAQLMPPPVPKRVRGPSKNPKHTPLPGETRDEMYARIKRERYHSDPEVLRSQQRAKKAKWNAMTIEEQEAYRRAKRLKYAANQQQELARKADYRKRKRVKASKEFIAAAALARGDARP